MKFLKLALCCVFWTGICYAQTSIRPDQIAPGTPDITWAPGGPGYQIGSTVPWRLDTNNPPVFSSADNAMVVEATGCASGCTATLPAATSSGPLSDGAGFSIVVGPGTLTLNATGSSTINNQSSIKFGPYQVVSLYARASKWYATMSVPQPATQTGATVLCDNMTWTASCGATVATISGVNPPSPVNFISPSTSSPITTVTATCSAGSCAGATFAPGTAGSCTGAASADNAKFVLASGGALSSGSTTVPAGTYKIGVTVTLTGATGSGTCYPMTLVGAAGAAITLAQPGVNANTSSFVNSQAVTINGTVSGHLLTVEAGGFTGSTALSVPTIAVTSGAGTTCNASPGTASGAVAGGNGSTMAIYYCISGGGNVTLTATWSGSPPGFVEAAVQEWAGALTTGVDAGLGNTTITGGTASALQLTPNQNNSLVISFMAAGGGAGPTSVTGCTQEGSGICYTLVNTTSAAVTHTYNFATAPPFNSAAITAFKHP